LIALRGDELTLRRAAEIARAGIAELAARQLDLEVPVAVEREVKSVAGRLQRTLRIDPRGRLNADARAEVETVGIGGLARGLLPATRAS
jgi:hypothetical protein